MSDNHREEQGPYHGLCETWREAVRVAELAAIDTGRRMRVARDKTPMPAHLMETFGWKHAFGWTIREVDAPKAVA